MRSGGLPIWWWDQGIHLSDKLIQMMVDIVMTVIGPLYFWDINKWEVETYSIGQYILESSCGLTGLEFSETLSHERIQDGGFSPFGEISLGF
jgi:hypothetical protein